MQAPVMTTEYRPNLRVEQICPECKEDPPNLVEAFSSGDMVCGSCGLVLGDRIVDTRSEWRTFSNDDSGGSDPSRVGDASNPLLSGSQLETSISFMDGMTGRAKVLMKAMNKTNNDKLTRQLISAYSEITAMSDAAGLPGNVADSAKLVFKRAIENKSVKGKSQESVVAACIFIACRHEGVPRTFKEICALTRVPKKDIGRVFKILEGEMNTDKNFFKGITVTESLSGSGTTSAEDLMSRYCNRLGLSQQAYALTKQLARRINELGVLAGRSPISVAASGILMMSHLLGTPKTAREIAEIAGVSDGTIRNAYKILYASRNELIDKKWLEDGKGSMGNLPSS